MANREAIERVALDFFRYLSQNYAAKVTTANSERTARLIGGETESFTISSGDVLALSVQGGAEQLVTLTTGTRTAAQIVTDINDNTTGITAADDGNGAVQVTSDTAPASGVPSAIKVLSPSSGTDASATLGLYPGQEDQRALLSKPRFIYRPTPHRVLPEVQISRAVFQAGANVRSDLDTITLTLMVRDTATAEGSAPVAAAELVERHMDIIRDLVDADHSVDQAGLVTFTEVERMQADPTVYEQVGSDGTPLQTLFAEGTMQVSLRTYQL